MNRLNRKHFTVGVSFTALQATRVMGANDRIGIAIVGCGMRGLLGEVLQYSKESNVEVTGVCDMWKRQRETAAERVKKTGAADPQPFAHFKEALASPAVDAMLISTPNHQRCTQPSAAVRARKDVYVEKPLTMNMKELVSAIDTVKKSVQCGTKVRSSSPSSSARPLVCSGGREEIFKIEPSRNSLHPHAGRMVHRDSWHGSHTQFIAHFIDPVHFVTGAKYPDRVTAMGDRFRRKDSTPDLMEVPLEYKEGFLVRYSTSFGTNANSLLKFLGTRGTMDAMKCGNPWWLTGDGMKPGLIV